MKIMIKQVVLSLIILSYWGSLYSQDDLPIKVDRELWNTLKIKYKFNKKVSANVEQALRLDNDISEVKSIFTEAGVKVKLPLGSKLDIGYRHVYGSEGMQRFYAGLDNDIDVYRWKFNLGSKIEYNDERDPEEDDQFRWREKLTISYNIPKTSFEPRIFGELFFPIKDGIDYNRWRLGARLSYEISKSHEVTIGYQIQDTQRRKSIRRDHIFVVMYAYEISG